MKRVAITLDEQTLELVDRIVADEVSNRSQVIRSLIRQAIRARPAPQPSAAPDHPDDARPTIVAEA